MAFNRRRPLIVLFWKFAKINVKIFHVYEWEWSPSRRGLHAVRTCPTTHMWMCMEQYTGRTGQFRGALHPPSVVKLVSILAQG